MTANLENFTLEFKPILEVQSYQIIVNGVKEVGN